MTRQKSRSEDRARSRRRHRSRESDSSKRRIDRGRSRDGGSQKLYDKIGRQKEYERDVWEYHNVTIIRVPTQGLGIAVSGGRDNSHFPNGDHSIVISDVLKAGPADGKLQINDQIVAANGISLENVDYSHAIHVLRECGNRVNMVIKRRMLLPSTASDSQSLKVTLRRNKKKDDFGIILGCRIYIREVTNSSLLEKSGSVKEGDIIMQINKSSAECLTLKEAKKLIDASGEKLHLVVKRDSINVEDPRRLVRRVGDPYYTQNKDLSSPSQFIDVSTNRMLWSNHNFYAPYPTRGTYISNMDRNDDKKNLYGCRPYDEAIQRGIDIKLLQHLQQINNKQRPNFYGRFAGNYEESDCPPRPPLPSRNEFISGQELHSTETYGSMNFSPLDIRRISYHKDGSMGFRLTGGNEVGVFVSTVHAGSAPHLQGLQQGDKILKVNDSDSKDLTREDVIKLLLNAKNKVTLTVLHCKEEFKNITACGKKDSFHIRTHFNYESSGKEELNFLKGEVFHVIDTLHNDAVGSWLVYRVGNNGQDIQKGVIPNRTRAEEYCKIQDQANKGKLDSRSSFFKRRAHLCKSLQKINWEDIVFGDGEVQFSAYEEVILKHPGFLRPVVLFGSLADVAKSKLLEECPNRFESPKVDSWVDVVPKAHKTFGIFRLKAIRDIIEKDKHALLEIPPSALDRLNYTQMYPIVIFLRAENKNMVKELRDQYLKANLRDVRKLYDHEMKLEKLWFHAFSAVVPVTTNDSWYMKLKQIISKQQQQKIWVCVQKPPNIVISDDFLFPVSPRPSCMKSSENDREAKKASILDLQTDKSPIKDKPLMKSCSDPNLEFNNDIQGNANENFFLPKGSPVSLGFDQRLSPELSSYSGYSTDPFTSFPVEHTNVHHTEPHIYRSMNGRPAPPPRNISLPRKAYSTERHTPHSEAYSTCISKDRETRVHIDLLRYERKKINNTGSKFPYYSISNPIKGGMSSSILKCGTSDLQNVVDRHLQYSEGNNNAGKDNLACKYYQSQKAYTESQVNENFPIISNTNDNKTKNSVGSSPTTTLCTTDEVEKSEQTINAFDCHDHTVLSPSDINNTTSGCATTEGEESEYNVIDTVSGVFDINGGVLTSKKTGVQLTVPSGAISVGEQREIYFKVCASMPSLDEQTGETLMSPLVMCGPHGLQFKIPVELRIPHFAAVGSNDWKHSSESTNVDTGETKDSECDSENINFIIVPVDQF